MTHVLRPKPSNVAVSLALKSFEITINVKRNNINDAFSIAHPLWLPLAPSTEITLKTISTIE